MDISLKKIAGRILALLWSASVLLLAIGCDLVQLNSGNELDSSKENELLAQAEEIFQSTVEDLSSDGLKLDSNPSRLFDPGKIVPRWDESCFYKRISKSGEEYWYICTPIEVDFIYRYLKFRK